MFDEFRSLAHEDSQTGYRSVDSYTLLDFCFLFILNEKCLCHVPYTVHVVVFYEDIKAVILMQEYLFPVAFITCK